MSLRRHYCVKYGVALLSRPFVPSAFQVLRKNLARSIDVHDIPYLDLVQINISQHSGQVKRRPRKNMPSVFARITLIFSKDFASFEEHNAFA
jgi:hypothetical protein